MQQDLSNNIDWENNSSARKSLPLGLRRWQAKFSTSHIAVGTMAKRRKHQELDNCPRCSLPGENTDHVLQCKETGAINLWNKSVSQMRHTLTEQNTAPEIRNAILHIMNKYRDNKEPETTDWNYPHMNPILHKQKILDGTTSCTANGPINGCYNNKIFYAATNRKGHAKDGPLQSSTNFS